MAKALKDPSEVSDPKRFGEAKARVLSVMEAAGLMRLDGSGRPSTSRRAKGKFVQGFVHSSLLYDHLWLIEELERVTGQKAQVPAPPLPEAEEEEESLMDREEGDVP